MATKLIFFTGGVISSVGKGVTAASVGRLLKARGFDITIQKLDPYLNVDPGTLSPYQHGEVFVLDDGSETDLDLGHYERFCDLHLKKTSTVTTGQVYEEVINRERRGDYLGGTIQVIPHITNEIKRRIDLLTRSTDADIALIEVGGRREPGCERGLPDALDHGGESFLREAVDEAGPARVDVDHAGRDPHAVQAGGAQQGIELAADQGVAAGARLQFHLAADGAVGGGAVGMEERRAVVALDGR